MPSYNGQVAKDRLELTATQIASDIRYVQQLALAEEEAYYKICFYPNANQYIIRLGVEVIKIGAIPTGVKLDGTNFNDHTLRISSRGLPVNGFGGTIKLTAGKKQKHIIVASGTGRVRVSDQAPKSDAIL